MTRSRWHIQTEDGQVTVCRQLPARFDVSATATLPAGHGVRYAHQIRQDMWRALQNVRGFSPVVRLDPIEGGWRVTAGGRVLGTPSRSVVAQIEDLLHNRAFRQRWERHAARKIGVNA